MRRRWLIALCWTLAAGAARAQDVVPAKHAEPAPARTRDLTKLTPPQRQFYLAAHRGMDWLRLTNKQDGKFVYGFLPALRTPMEGDSYLAQAGAACALARASRFFHDDPAAAIARQALLTLLLETATDPKDPTARHTAAPPHLVNRLAAHGQLVLAVHDLPRPGTDLLDQADQLCQYLRAQQHPDGALWVAEAGEDAKSACRDAAVLSSGLALHGVILSHRLRPAPWKPDMLRKALACYQGCWKQQKGVPLAVGHTPAYAEAYLLTKDRAFADQVFAMNDWLCTLQYRPGEAARPHWAGGFQPWLDGKAIAAPPDIGSAEAAESLAEACRVARAAGDVTRLRHYEQALESSLLFLLTLQYNEAKTQHYVEGFRPALLGAFHASHQDGNLRLDYTQHALAALVGHLEQVME
jgi:hypothetical protein